MAFMKDILTHNIPIWEECAATPFVQEVQTGKLPLEKFKRYMIQDSIYLKNYARIYGKAIFHAATLREIQLYYSMLNFVNDTESEVRLDYLKQFCITDDDIELIAPSIRLIVKANDTGLEHTTISLEKLVDMSDGLTLTTMQEAIASKEATIRQVGISIIGVTLFLLLFSIITFASTIITNIATKKREYAMFQSIGMTRKQTEKMALCESCVLAIGSLILTLILGIILGQILIKGLISAGIFYLSYTFPLALFTVYCIVVVLIILMITISAFYSLQKTPLVERLRIVD